MFNKPKLKLKLQPEFLSENPAQQFEENQEILSFISKYLVRNTVTGNEIYINGKWVSLSGGGYTDRGDPSSYDFRIADLTDDDTWRDLDLSAIVATGAKAVSLHLYFRASAVGGHIYFRKKGNSNEIAIAAIRTQVADVGINADLVVSLDDDYIIQYKAPSSSSIIDIAVKGWWS